MKTAKAGDAGISQAGSIEMKNILKMGWMVSFPLTIQM